MLYKSHYALRALNTHEGFNFSYYKMVDMIYIFHVKSVLLLLSLNTKIHYMRGFHVRSANDFLKL